MNQTNQTLTLNKTEFFKLIGYFPHAGQLEIHQAPESNIVIVAGRQSGKSTLVSAEITFEMVEGWLTKNPKRIWVCGLTYKKCKEVFDKVYDNIIRKLKLPTQIASWKNLQIVMAEVPVMFEGVSADNPDSLVGATLDYLCIDEAAKMNEDIYHKYLRASLLVKKGKLKIITTPEGHNWIYDLWSKANKGLPNWNAFRFPTSINPVVDPAWLEQEKLTMSEDLFLQEYEASFIHRSGKFFKEFTNANVIDSFEFTEEHQIEASIDFGYRQPIIQWFATKGNISVCFDEFTDPKTTTEGLIQVIKSKPYANRVLNYFGDPAGDQKNAQTGKSDIKVLSDAGIKIKSTRGACDRSVEKGADRLRVKLCDVKGNRFLFFTKNCTKTIQSFQSAIFEKDSNKYAKDGNDHCIDAVRYFIINKYPIIQDQLWFGRY